MSVTVKIYFTLPTGKQEIRRFTTAEKEVLPALLTFLDSTYKQWYQPPLRFMIQYDDGEDLLTVSSEVELQEGLRLHAAHGGGSVWKLMCRFDDSPESASNLGSPSVLSGMSTPSVNTMLANSTEFPPSPSMRAAPKEEKTVVDEKSNLLGSVTSPRSDDDADLVDAAGSSSDDEYVRIEEDAPVVAAAAPVVPKQVATVTPTPEPVAAAVVVAPTATEAPVPVVTAPAITAVEVETDPMDALFEQRAPERFACLQCPKLFKGRNFIVEHIRAKHPQVVAQATQTSAPPSQGTNSTQTDASAPVLALAVATSTQTPLVDETSPKSSPVEIADVTGHHDHAGEPANSPEPEVTEPTSSAPAGAPVVHQGIACDGCGQSPLIGNRYHCTACTMPGGFDLCESCESSGDKHPADHVLLKMRTPANVPVGTAQRHLHCPRRGGAPSTGPRPRAQFISDVTLADGLQVQPGETLQKVWSIKNTGDEAWPIGTRLVFAGGDLAPESDGVTDPFGAAVPYAGPNDVVHVSLSIVVPNEVGRFRGTFRLEAPDRTRFGPRIWIDLIVPDAAAAEPDAEVAVEQPKSAPVEAVEVSKAAAPVPLPVAHPVAQPAASASSPPVASTPAAATVSESKQAEEVALAAEFAAAV